MPDALPAALRPLLDAKDDAVREARWTEFIAASSRLILHVTRSGGGQHDAAMDRYAFVLEQLRRDDFRRLRAFVADGRSEFSTWLVVVVQRLCRDHQRHRYGRFRPNEQDSLEQEEERAARRRLVDLIGAEVDLSSLGDRPGRDAESVLRQGDLHQALAKALARLDQRDRLLIKLRFEDDLPMPEVASNLGFPTRFHAYRRLKEVLGDLRRALERQGVGEAAP
jgi:RNA polymerase sigma factor (sigma-70 family)